MVIPFTNWHLTLHLLASYVTNYEENYKEWENKGGINAVIAKLCVLVKISKARG